MKRGAREKRRGGMANDYDRHRTLIAEARELEESYASAVAKIERIMGKAAPTGKRPGLEEALTELDEVCGIPLEIHDDLLESAGRPRVRRATLSRAAASARKGPALSVARVRALVSRVRSVIPQSGMTPRLFRQKGLNKI